MSFFKSFCLAIFVAVSLLGQTAGSAQADCNPCATEWSDGSVVNLGALPARGPCRAPRAAVR
jgi:hypothetical protein